MINKATHQQAYSIASLHHHTINQGFLPKLGNSFLKSLYRFLIAKELLLGCKENDEVRSFVSYKLWAEKQITQKTCRIVENILIMFEKLNYLYDRL